MKRRGAGFAAVALVVAGAMTVSACALPTQYTPQVVARGELTLRYRDSRYEAWAGGRRVARGLTWSGLPEYVRCVPAAEEQARKAGRAGRAASPLSWLGGIMALSSLGSFVAVAVDPAATLPGKYPDGTDKPNGIGRIFAWLGGGFAMAVVGTIIAGVGRASRNAANGHAVDALNFYNDAVGSLGATCDDLTYPAPAGPGDEPPPPPPDALPLPAPAPAPAPAPTGAPVDPY